jgi:hypothetical protein
MGCIKYSVRDHLDVINPWINCLHSSVRTTIYRLEEGDYTGLAKLTILTSTLQFIPIVLVFLLPNTKVSVSAACSLIA